MKEEITKELLEDLYYDRGLSGKKIASLLGISRGHFLRLKKIYQLEKDPRQIIDGAKKSQLKPAPSKEQIISDYIDKNLTVERLSRKYSLGKCKIHRLLKDYDIVKDKAAIVETREKTCLRKYGTKQASASEVVKAKIRGAYKGGKVYEKIIETKLANGTWNTSKPEEKAYELLLQYYPKDDIIRQYKSPQYPYPCDFYIKSIDTYLEFQGSWCHGREPFDKNNPIHQKIVEKWQAKNTEYFSYAIKIWTVQDPEKRRVAKDNNLNWEEFFNLEDLENWLEVK